MASITHRLEQPMGATARTESSRWRLLGALELSGPAQMILASLSGGAGVIHLAMVSSHMEETVVEGIGFALAGWFQLAFAVLALTRPSRALLHASILVNLALIGAWALSRT